MSLRFSRSLCIIYNENIPYFFLNRRGKTSSLYSSLLESRNKILQAQWGRGAAIYIVFKQKK